MTFDAVSVPSVNISQGQTTIRLGGVGFDPASAPPRGNKEKNRESGGHTYGVVYANALARRALDGGAKFPPGSIIVREKLSKLNDATPILLAVMFKRAPGFNPKGGDWEFMTVDGGLTKITSRQKKGSCLDCHASQRKSDFVFPTQKQ